MMIPLELRVERLEEPESFADTRSDRLPVHPASPRYHVTAVALDLEQGRVLSYEFWSMVDLSREPYASVGRVTYRPMEMEAKMLLRIRDALDEVLPPREDKR